MTKRKNPEDLLKVGRPSKYKPELGEKICRVVATNTDGLKKICRNNPDFPADTTILEWRLDFPEFRSQYEMAKRAQAELMADEIAEIADDSTRDMIMNDNGNMVQNTEYVQRSRLRIDARKWIACKLLPKIYGDKITSETTVTIKHEDALKELE